MMKNLTKPRIHLSPHIIRSPHKMASGSVIQCLAAAAC